MGLLADKTRDAHKQVSRRGELPGWFALAPAVGLGLAGLLVACGLIFPGLITSGRSAPAPMRIYPAASQTAGPAPALPVSGDGGLAGQPGEAGSVTLSILGQPGKTVTVPQAADTLATRGAVALFTGSFAGLALAPGQVPRVLGRDSNATSSGSPLVVDPTQTGGSWVFQVSVRPRGAAFADLQQITVTVVTAGGGYALMFPLGE